MKNKIILTIDHNNAKRMEYFLNGVEDELKEIAFDWRNLKLADRITAACQFISTTSASPITIRVFFCDSYSDANEIAKVNSFPYEPKAKWSVNGDLLYIVESQDEEKVSEVLGLFAGEE
jgi:hypothetical protein